MTTIIISIIGGVLFGLAVGAGITAKLMNKKVKDVAHQVAELAVNTLVDEAKLIEDNGKKYFNDKILSKIDDVEDRIKEFGQEIESEAKDALRDFIINVNKSILNIKSKVNDIKEDIEDDVNELKEDYEEFEDDAKHFIKSKVKGHPLYILIKKIF